MKKHAQRRDDEMLHPRALHLRNELRRIDTVFFWTILGIIDVLAVVFILSVSPLGGCVFGGVGLLSLCVGYYVLRKRAARAVRESDAIWKRFSMTPRIVNPSAPTPRRRG